MPAEQRSAVVLYISRNGRPLTAANPPHLLASLQQAHTPYLALQKLLQLSRDVHLLDDVRAPNKLSLYVQLRDGGPLGVGLDGLPQTGVVHIVEYVDDLKVGLVLIQELQHLEGEATLRLDAGALDEGNDLGSERGGVGGVVGGEVGGTLTHALRTAFRGVEHH